MTDPLSRAILGYPQLSPRTPYPFAGEASGSYGGEQARAVSPRELLELVRGS